MRSVVMKAKVCLVGEAAVGKTSLIRRYVLDQYDDRYETTLGAKVTKKELRIPIKEKHLEVQLDMTIWDVMGDETFRELLRKAYFAGSRGVLAVADLTRRSTLDGVSGWIDAVGKVVMRVPVLPASRRSSVGSMLDPPPGQQVIPGDVEEQPPLLRDAQTPAGGGGVEPPEACEGPPSRPDIHPEDAPEVPQPPGGPRRRRAVRRRPPRGSSSRHGARTRGPSPPPGSRRSSGAREGRRRGSSPGPRPGRYLSRAAPRSHRKSWRVGGSRTAPSAPGTRTGGASGS